MWWDSLPPVLDKGQTGYRAGYPLVLNSGPENLWPSYGRQCLRPKARPETDQQNGLAKTGYYFQGPVCSHSVLPLPRSLPGKRPPQVLG